MNNADVEMAIVERVREASETAIREVLAEINSNGRCFQPLDDFLWEWAEPGSDETLHISCAIGVDVAPRSERPLLDDPVVDAFLARADAGDAEADHLNLLEGDIANGGFMQLYENKGLSFIQESIALLRKIGSSATLRIVEDALALLQNEDETLRRYDDLIVKMDRLDTRFWDLKESIAVLFERYRQGSDG